MNSCKCRRLGRIDCRRRSIVALGSCPGGAKAWPKSWIAATWFLAALLSTPALCRADIFQWEYVNPADPSLGIQQSTLLCPDGAGVNAAPSINLSNRNLTMAYLTEANLTDATFHAAILTNANLWHANLTHANFSNAMLAGADFTNALVDGAIIGATTSRGFTAAQLYSTASYRAKELARINLSVNDMTGWNFNGQNLSNAAFVNASLADADFTNSIVDGVFFSSTTSHGFSAAQLYSTASYQNHNLQRIKLRSNTLSGWTFIAQNLTSADFSFAMLTGADFSQANLTNANFTSATLIGADLTNATVEGALMNGSTTGGFTAAQLYSTASYQDHNLRHIDLRSNDLTGWNFIGQDLSNAGLVGATLTGTDFTNAVVKGASFSDTTLRGFTADQLYSTASYQVRNLTNIYFTGNDLTGWNFNGQNLSNADLSSAKLTGTNFLNAIVESANFGTTTPHGFTATQLYSTASYHDHNLVNIVLESNDLTAWNFTRQNLAGANLLGATLSGANFSQTNLSNASFVFATLTDADFSDSIVMGTQFGNTTPRGFKATQLYSTASYRVQNLNSIELGGNDLTGWNFSSQNLTNASFSFAKLTGADFTNASVTGASFGDTTSDGFTPAQLYSTASYQARHLAGISMWYNDLTGWDFSGQNLTMAEFLEAVLARADFTGADLRGATNTVLVGAVVKNMIGPDFAIDGLKLISNERLVVRDLDLDAPNPIVIRKHLTMDSTGSLQLLFDEDTWDSLITFDNGIPVTLGGQLALDFASGVDIASQFGRTIHIFDWTGVAPVGDFQIVSSYRWDLSRLYTSGDVTLVPEPASAMLGGIVAIALATALRPRKRMSPFQG